MLCRTSRNTNSPGFIIPRVTALGSIAQSNDRSQRFRYTTGFGVRRDKAALFQWVRVPPGERSSRKQPEQSWR